MVQKYAAWCQSVRRCAKNVQYVAENVWPGAKNVRLGTKNVRHGFENVRLRILLISAAVMLYFYQMEVLSLTFQMLQKDKYKLIFYYKHQNNQYLH